MSEVEALSCTNARLIADQKSKAYFDKYDSVCEQLKKLQTQYDMLVNHKFEAMKAIQKIEPENQRGKNYFKKLRILFLPFLS